MAPPAREATMTDNGQSNATWLSRANAGACLVFVVQLNVLLLRTPPGTVQLHVQYAHYSDDGEHLQLARVDSIEFDTVVLTMIFFLFSAVLHGYRLALYCMSSDAQFIPAVNWWRWADYAATAPTMIVIVGISVGIFELCELISLYALMSVTVMFGVVVECLHRDAYPKPIRKPGGTGAVALLMVFVTCMCITLVCATVVGIAVSLSQLNTNRVEYLSFVTTAAYLYTIAWAIALRGRKEYVQPENSSNKNRILKPAADTVALKTGIFTSAFVPYSLMWISIFTRFALALSHADGDVPDSVYCIVAVMFIGFTGTFPVIQFLETFTSTVPVYRAELLYATAGVANKVALGWFMQMGVQRAQSASSR